MAVLSFRYSRVMRVREDQAEGMVDTRPFARRSMTTKAVMPAQVEGKKPVRLLDCRLRVVRPVRVLHMDGRVPVKALPARLMLVRLVHSSMLEGRVDTLEVTAGRKDRSKEVATDPVQVTPSQELEQGSVPVAQEDRAEGLPSSVFTSSKDTL